MATDFTPSKYYCKFCDITCRKKSDWTRHISTTKHKWQQNGNKMATDFTPHHICCNCNKSYKDRTGLWRHSKKCIANDNSISSNTICR
jgi:hypothetical protein